MLGFNLALNLIFSSLDAGLESKGFLLKLVFLKFEKCLLLGGVEQLLLDFLNSVIEVFMARLNLLDRVGDLELLTVDAILVCLMVVTFFPQLFPRALRLLSNNLG